MSDDVKAAVAEALREAGVSPQPRQEQTPAPSPAPSPEPSYDADQIAEAAASKLMEKLSGGTQQKQQSPIDAFREAMGLNPDRPTAKPDRNFEAPRKVDHLEKDGLVDVTSLTREQIDAMGIDAVVGHFERSLKEGRRRSGAPRLPKVLRDLEKGNK